MAARKVIWSVYSRQNLIEIFEFFNFRNKSKTYSLKLHRLFQSEVKRIIIYPEIGIITNKQDIRGLIVNDYTIFYKLSVDSIEIITVWDNRQNPNKIDYK